MKDQAQKSVNRNKAESKAKDNGAMSTSKPQSSRAKSSQAKNDCKDKYSHGCSEE